MRSGESMKKRVISFSVTDEVHKLIEYTAKAKGKTVSSLSKETVYTYVNTYGPKGPIAELYKNPGKKATDEE
jgi:hypothetical protein